MLRRVAFTTVKLPAEVAVPFGVVTLIGPAEALMAGTVITICVLVLPVTIAETPFTVTVPPVRFVPVMVTVVPGGPLVGVKLLIVGGIGGVVLVADWSHQLTAAVPQNLYAKVMRLVQSLWTGPSSKTPEAAPVGLVVRHS